MFQSRAHGPGSARLIPVTLGAVALREILGGSKAALGGWCVLPGSFSAEIMARAGFDWVCIDVQHGLMGEEDMLVMLQGVATAGVPSMVRVPPNDPGWIMKALDAGAAAGACRYPPEGYRSWGPTRVSLGVPDYSPELANRAAICAVMVETVPALDRLDEIVAVKGVDAVFIGPSDFAVSMGYAPRSDEPEHRRRLEAVPAVCRAHGVIAGIACGSSELAARWKDAGYTMLALPSDMVLLRRGAAEMLESLRR